MDDGSRRNDDGADGWVDPYARTEFGLEAVSGDARQPHTTQQAAPGQAPYPAQNYPLAPAPKPPNTVEEGKAMAMLSHSSVLLGMPLFVIPMLQRENDFALHHAKAAAVNFIFFLVAVSITVVTCGLAFPLIFLAYVPMVVGAVNAANGQLAGGLAWGGAGERMFPGVRRKDDEKQLLP